MEKEGEVGDSGMHILFVYIYIYIKKTASTLHHPCTVLVILAFLLFALFPQSKCSGSTLK
jgi:hypothetical protein